MTIRSFLFSRFMRVLAIIIIIGVVCHLMLIALAAHHLSVVERQISAEGLPQQLESILPVAKAEDNAAHDYEKAFVMLSLDSEDIYDRQRVSTFSPCYATILALLNRKVDLKDPLHPRKEFLDPTLWSSDEQSSTWETLSTPEFTTVRELLIEAANKPLCVFNLTWSDGPAMRLPMVNFMRNAAYLLTCHALLCQNYGDTQAMRDDFQAALGLAYHVQQIPVLICNLTSSAIETITYKEISLALSKAPLGDTTELERRMATRFDPGALSRDLNCERIMMGQSVFSSHGSSLILPMMTMYHGYLMTPLRLYDHACFDFILAQASKAARAQLPLPNLQPPALSVISRLLMPAMSMISQDIEKQRRIRAIATTALALEHAHRDSGSYPSRLADLVPKYLSPQTLADLSSCVFVSKGSRWYLDGMKESDPATRDSRKAGNRHLLWESPEKAGVTRIIVELQ